MTSRGKYKKQVCLAHNQIGKIVSKLINSLIIEISYNKSHLEDKQTRLKAWKANIDSSNPHDVPLPVTIKDNRSDKLNILYTCEDFALSNYLMCRNSITLHIKDQKEETQSIYVKSITLQLAWGK